MSEMLNAEIWTVVQTGDGNAVLLRTLQKNIAVPIFIGQLEVQSMLIGMEDLKLPRPLTHDLFLSLLESQNLVLDRAEIHDVRENIFYARLVIAGDRNGKPLHLDCRPSDALCLATRRKCPILVSEDIIDLAGIPVDFFIEAMQEVDLPRDDKGPPGGKRRRLLEELAEAVEKEEYEQAAKIRDVIKAMEGTDREAGV